MIMRNTGDGELGNCSFCSQPAGFLRSEHAECRKRHDDVATKLPAFFVDALQSSVEPVRFKAVVADAASHGFIKPDEFRAIAISGIQRMIVAAFSDRVLSEHEDERIVGLCNAFELSANDLGEAGMRLARASLLQTLDKGELPNTVVANNIPIMLAAGESVIWLFNQVVYLTTRSKTQYVGGSSGVSIRVMKGVYYRVGATKGEAIKTEYLSEEARGSLVLTNKNIFFLGGKTLKVALKKLVAVRPYSDGLEISREGVSAKPMIFRFSEPHFACDVIARLHQMAA
jgi:hypothetical protein